MNNTKLLHLIFLLITGCTLILMLSLNSCINSGVKNYTSMENSNGDGYKTFITTKEGVPYFSFEYLSYYSLSDQTGLGNPAMYVVLNGATEEEFLNGTVKDIEVEITNVDPKYLGLPDAETSMEHRISIRKWALERNYRLIEKHKAVVDGIEGWEIVITFRERPERGAGDGIPRDPAFIVDRELFFDYQGMTWQISLYTDADSYEKETKAVFENLLRTFKFHE